MITVSEPSAEATQLVRTSQYAPARRRNSVPRADTRRQADARPISVHTEERPTGSPSPQGSPGSSYVGSPASRAPLAASLRDGASATLDPGDPTQRQPGMRERGASRSSPPATGRAKSVPDTAVTHEVQRGATGTTQPVAPRPRPRPVIAGQGPFVLRGGSRIQTLEGISRRIYSSLAQSRAGITALTGRAVRVLLQ